MPLTDEWLDGSPSHVGRPVTLAGRLRGGMHARRRNAAPAPPSTLEAWTATLHREVDDLRRLGHVPPGYRWSNVYVPLMWGVLATEWAGFQAALASMGLPRAPFHAARARLQEAGVRSPADLVQWMTAHGARLQAIAQETRPAYSTAPHVSSAAPYQYLEWYVQEHWAAVFDPHQAIQHAFFAISRTGPELRPVGPIAISPPDEAGRDGDTLDGQRGTGAQTTAEHVTIHSGSDSEDDATPPTPPRHGGTMTLQ